MKLTGGCEGELAFCEDFNGMGLRCLSAVFLIRKPTSGVIKFKFTDKTGGISRYFSRIRIVGMKNQRMWQYCKLRYFFLMAAVAASASAFTFETLDDPNAIGYTLAAGVNNSGQVVGYFESDYGYRGFSYSQGMFTTLNVPFAGNSSSQYATAINDVGQIAGFYDSGNGILNGFLESAGTFSSIIPPNASGSTHLSGLNDSGGIVGDYAFASSSHGLLVEAGTFSTLDYPGAIYTLAEDINDGGEIVGRFVSNVNQSFYGFVYQNGVFTVIDDPDAAHGSPNASGTNVFGIDSEGDLVGNYFDTAGKAHGFIRSPEGLYITVDFPGAITTTILGINDAGEIVGGYFDSTGTHGFIATPVPEPPSSVLFAVSLGACALGTARAIGPKRDGRMHSVVAHQVKLRSVSCSEKKLLSGFCEKAVGYPTSLSD